MWGIELKLIFIGEISRLMIVNKQKFIFSEQKKSLNTFYTRKDDNFPPKSEICALQISVIKSVRREKWSIIGIGDNINSTLSSPQKLFFVDVPPWLGMRTKNTTGNLGTISTVPLILGQNNTNTSENISLQKLFR